MSLIIPPNATVLFQGDSITDAGRDRSNIENLGGGYAMQIAAWFAAMHPGHGVRFLNTGISGNRACDLKARWQTDALDLKPDFVSIMIGINDMWRRYDSGNPTTAEAFEADYRDILTQVREKLGAKIILIEPFLLPVKPEHESWYLEDLSAKIVAVRRLARAFSAILIPLDGLFAAATTQSPPAFWAADAVHPSPAGHALIARAWLEAVGAL